MNGKNIFLIRSPCWKKCHQWDEKTSYFVCNLFSALNRCSTKENCLTKNVIGRCALLMPLLFQELLRRDQPNFVTDGFSIGIRDIEQRGSDDIRNQHFR